MSYLFIALVCGGLLVGAWYIHSYLAVALGGLFCFFWLVGYGAKKKTGLTGKESIEEVRSRAFGNKDH